MRNPALWTLLVAFGTGCLTTDVGNPVEAKVDFKGYEEEPVNALTLDNGITIDRAFVSVAGLRFADADNCATDQTVDFAPRVTIDLLSGTTSPEIPVIRREMHRFCAVHMSFAPVPSNPTDDMILAEEAEMAGYSVLVEGTRADGRPFVLRASFEDAFEIDAVSSAFELDSREHLFVAFAMNEWFDAAMLDAAPGATEETLVIDAQNAPEILDFARHGMTGSTRLFRNLDADDELDRVETSDPLAVGVAIDRTFVDDDDDSSSNNELMESEEDQACQRMVEGPSVAVAAAPDDTGDLEEAFHEETRVDIAFTDIAGGKGGVVQYTSDGSDNWLLFLSDDVPLRVVDATGTDVAATPLEMEGVCAQVAVGYEVVLPAGTYTLEFGPTTVESVRLVTEDD